MEIYNKTFKKSKLDYCFINVIYNFSMSRTPFFTMVFSFAFNINLKVDINKFSSGKYIGGLLLPALYLLK